MRVFTSLLLAVSSAFAYQVTYPGGDQGWTTSGPNYLKWERVDTDPLNFTAVLTNVNTGYDEILDSVVDGTLGSNLCSTPSGGWPTGSGFRVNLARDSQDLDSLLAQSNEFNITATSSNGSTSSASVQTTTPSVTVTTTTTGVTSSDTSTTPTGTSAATLGADTQAGLLTAVAALTALITTLF